MASLKEIQERQVKPLEQGVTSANYVVVSGLGSLTSHILHHLMFRLENTEGDSVVILYPSPTETREVTIDDVENGLYVPNDVGKDKITVLQARYGETFETPVIRGDATLLAGSNHIKSLVGNMFFLDCGKESNRQFNTLFQTVQNAYREAESPYVVASVHTYVDGEETHFSARVREGTGRVMGAPMEQVDGHSGGTFLQNTLLANYVFNYINGLLSMGMTVDVQSMKGDVTKGDSALTKEYFTPPLVTVLDTYGIDVTAVPMEELQAFHTAWMRLEEQVLPSVLTDYTSHYDYVEGNETDKMREALHYFKFSQGAYTYPLARLQSVDGEVLTVAIMIMFNKLKEETDDKLTRTRTGRQRLEDAVKMWLLLKEYCKQKGTWLL
ncbi:hypothetical protein [Bacillus thuringiensis]|uniref:hypothetical protein n=1 Tax=Bacillus thuringiensis TaxID=1428 RepID=UPI000BFCDF9D|nr:hypothetical protein [Bacillus thuringiensis]PGT89993.1 hypothetical protein COD17_09595 [Bacillus thuringiensis]